MDNLTIIIPYFNGEPYIQGLLKSIPRNIKTLVVDDHSDNPLDLSQFPRKKFPELSIIKSEVKGYFTGAVNHGIQNRKPGSDVLILNQDTELKGIRWMEFLQENRDIYGIIGETIAGTHPAYPQGYVHGTFMFIQNYVLEQVGLMNSELYPLWGSTCEYQLRACRKGIKVLPTQIPGFTHQRVGNYGSSIQTLLKREPEKKGILIRTPPEISVIIPAYNYGRYLRDAVNSLVGGETDLGYMEGQTFQSFEVVIVDDLSTDETQEVGLELADPWKGIKYIRRETNGGTPAANNTGIRNSHGKFLTILCADDMYEPWRLEQLYKVQIQNPHSFVYDDMRIFKEGERHPSGWKMKDYDFEEILYKNHVHAGIMFPRQAWEDVGGYPEEMRYGREDWAVNVALGIKGWCGKRVEMKPGYLYRREKQNRSLTNTSRDWHTRFLNQLKGLFPEVYGGKRPMGCCGGKGRKASSGNPNSQSIPTMEQAAVLGSQGLELIQYQGGNYGTETFYGESTGARYQFSKKRPIMQVDRRDVPGLLNIFEGKKQLFQKFVPPSGVGTVVKEPQPVKKEVQVPSPVEEEIPVEETVVSEEVSPDDFSTLKGVGRSTDKKLKEAGFMTFQDLFNGNLDDIAGAVGGNMVKAVSIQASAGDQING